MSEHHTHRMIAAPFAERITLDLDESLHLADAGFGTVERGKLRLSLLEAHHLLAAGKLAVLDGRKRQLTLEQFERRASRTQKQFWVRAAVYDDLRSRGYTVKTGLKYGAEFTVYDRGAKAGEEHAKWVVYPVYETGAFTGHDFAAKNRVAHSTKKRLLIAVVDDEAHVTYFEVRWVRP